MKPRILLVEDNTDLADGIRYNLTREGYDVLTAENGIDALKLAQREELDLLILDLMLPGMDGFAVLESMRRNGSTVPVIVLTARVEEMDKVRAFRLDADQYVTKPFGLLELLERIRMLLRRRHPSRGGTVPTDQATISFGDVSIDVAAHRVYRGGQPVSLRPKSFELLLAFVRRDGEVLSRQALLRDVWGHLAAVQTRTVDWHVADLRRQLEADPDNPRHFRTVWKVGYRFER